MNILLTVKNLFVLISYNTILSTFKFNKEKYL